MCPHFWTESVFWLSAASKVLSWTISVVLLKVSKSTESTSWSPPVMWLPWASHFTSIQQLFCVIDAPEAGFVKYIKSQSHETYKVIASVRTTKVPHTGYELLWDSPTPSWQTPDCCERAKSGTSLSNLARALTWEFSESMVITDADFAAISSVGRGSKRVKLTNLRNIPDKNLVNDRRF